MIEVQVLGPVRVLTEGRVAELGPPRRRALLAALAAEAGRVVPLETLSDRVWSGDAPASTAATVHAYVSRLRQGLREAGVEGELVTTVAPGYRLEVAPEAVDAHRFAELVRTARTAHETGDLLGARRSVGEALALWRGPAYEDVAAEFARREADRLDQQRAAAHELAATLDLELGRHAALLDDLPALLERLPLHEGLHASYVLALYRSARQADALAHLDVVRRLLLDELGVDPGPGLRTLHEQVLRQDPALDPPAPVVVADPGPGPGPDPVVTGPRMVGREQELAALGAAVDAALAGAPAVAAVAGEAGIGKTRLVEEAVDALAARGVVAAWGRAWEHDGAPALWPWTQALRELAERLEPAELARAVAGRGAGVAALVPELATEPGAPSAELAAVRLFDAVAAFLAVVAATRPVVVVLEDVHWADEATRQLTEYVVRHVRGAHLALVVTVRSPTDDGSRGGGELLGGLARSGRARRIDVTGLEEDDVRELVLDRTGSRIDDDTAAALVERTGGNPFFVAELVRLLVTDAGATTPVVPETVPDSIREVIGRRVERLDAVDQDLLRVAAVVGRGFDLDTVRQVSGLGEDVVDEAVDRATALGLLGTDPGGSGRHRFVHALTQQTLLETTGPARRRRLHGRVAAVLTEQHGDPGELVFHLGAAGGPEQLAQAVDVALASSQDSMRRGHYPAAEATLLRALALVARLGGPDAERREMAVRLRLWSFYAHTEGPHHERAAEQRELARELVDRLGDTADVLVRLEAEWATVGMRGQLAGSQPVVRDMALAAEAADDDLLRTAHHLAAATLDLAHHGDPRLGLAQLAAAERALVRVDDVPVGVFPSAPACSLRQWRALAHTLAGDLVRADEQLAELAAVIEAQPPTSSAYGSTEAAISLAVRDDPAAAVDWTDRAFELVARHALVEASAFVGVLHHWAHERLAPGTHLDRLEAALAETLQAPTMAFRPLLRGLVADARLRAGRTEAALSELDAALADADATSSHAVTADLVRRRAGVLARLGADAALVAAELERARAAAEERGQGLFLARLG